MKEQRIGSRPHAAIWDLAHARIRAHFNVAQNRLPLHRHPHFELLYIIRGIRLIELNGRCFQARPGHLVVFRPEQEHWEHPGTKHISYFVFRFRPDELTEVGMEFPDAGTIVQVVSLPRQEELCTLFNQMLKEQNQADESSQLLLGAYLVEFIVTLRRAIRESLNETTGTEQNILHTRIQKAVCLIEKDLTGNTDIKELARCVFMSPSYFSHVFREIVQESPKCFLINKRIAKAKDLLANTDWSGKKISEKLGYASPCYFYRQFRWVTGVTTSGYRAEIRSPQKNA